MYCPQCGHENPDDNKICSKCNCVLPDEEIEDASIIDPVDTDTTNDGGISENEETPLEENEIAASEKLEDKIHQNFIPKKDDEEKEILPVGTANTTSPNAASTPKKNFYNKDWFMWLMIVLLPPVGIIMMWHKHCYNMAQRITISVLFFIAFMTLFSIVTSNDANYEATISKQEASTENLISINDDLRTKIADLENKVDEAQPWFEMSDIEKEQLQAEVEAQKQAEKDAAEAKAAEEAAAKEAEEKQGYDTGITYNQLSRTPDDYEGKKVKFSGKVVQVMEGDDGSTQIRLATSGSYDNIILATYSSSIVSSRVLDDDNITIYGISLGLITYESTMGGDITIPAIEIDKIDQ